MIKFEKLLKLGHLETVLPRVKNYVDGSVSALAETVNDVMEDVDSSITSLETDMTKKENLLKDATAKTTLSDSDTVPLSDSAASNATKKITVANLKSVLKSYFDTFYNKYTHPTHTARSSGLYKVTVDSEGHVTGATAVTKSDITGLGIPSTNTTYSAMTGASASADGTSGLVPVPTAGKNTSFLRGDGTWAVPTDKDTTYSAGSGLSLSGTTINHSNSVTAGTAKGDNTKTLTFGGTFAIPTVTYDAQGHVTGKGTTTMTMPAAPTTISGNAATATQATKDSSGQQIDATYIKGLSVSGKTITYTKGDGTTGTITTQDTNTTYSAMTGATSSVAGTSGLVPAPAAGAQGKFLKGDGTWGTPTNTTYSAAGDSLGLVKSGGDVTIASGVITVNDDSHAHIISNVDGLQAALDAKEASGAAATALSDAKSYTDTKIADLIGSADTTMDTLGEIQAAMEDNADVVAALDTAIGSKASSADLTAHTGNKSNPHGVTLAQLGVTATADELNVMGGISASTTELNYMAGVTSNVQTQLGKKANLASPTFTGTPKAPTATAGTNTTQIATTAFVATAVSNGVSSKADASALTEHTEETGNVHGLALTDLGITATATELNKLGGVKSTTDELNLLNGVTATTEELNYMGGVTSNVQTQLNAKAPTSHASSETTYGAASATNYGHAKASGTVPKANGTAAVGSETATFARGDHIHPLQTSVSGNAGTATKLANAKTIAISGGATGTATGFDGSDNITIPVTALDPSKLSSAVPVAKGGTGATTAEAARTALGAAAEGHEHEDLASKSSKVAATLAAASWSGTAAPYTYAVTISGHANTTDLVELMVGDDMTAAQVLALQAANIVRAEWTANTTLTLYAYGTKPTVDAPVNIVVRKDI